MTTDEFEERRRSNPAVGEVAAEGIAAPNPFVGISIETGLRAFAVWGGGLLRHPARIAGVGAQFVIDSVKLRQDAPVDLDQDRRFVHPLWHRAGPYRFMAREYLLLRSALYRTVERSGLQGDAAERARFAVALVAEALAPSNNLLLNPAAAEEAWRTRGASLVSGASHLIDDLRNNGAMPAVTKRDAFAVGTDLACTPGQVVFRSEVCELIQFNPQAPQVHDVPLLMVPSPVNKYYFLDLAPGRSLAEYAVRSGIQFFAISWRNPTPAQRDWGLDTYSRAVADALEVVKEVTGSDAVSLLGVCAGGLINVGVQASQKGSTGVPIASATYLVSGLDSSWPTTFGALATARSADKAVGRTQRLGILPGRDIARSFAWMRPNELLWSLWVNNYILGKEPPSTDILFWNADLTNLPSRFHAEQVQLLRDNPFAEPGEAQVLDAEVDLSQLEVDSYYLAAIDDHIVPWQSCYRSAQLLGGAVRFVAASGGHIQCLVSPPTSKKARFMVGPQDLSREPAAWMESATAHAGTWWEDWIMWLADRSGPLRSAPAELGSAKYPPLQPAPGRYVHQRA